MQFIQIFRNIGQSVTLFPYYGGTMARNKHLFDRDKMLKKGKE
jgi:hypothetical protein